MFLKYKGLRTGYASAKARLTGGVPVYIKDVRTNNIKVAVAYRSTDPFASDPNLLVVRHEKKWYELRKDGTLYNENGWSHKWQHVNKEQRAEWLLKNA